MKRYNKYKDKILFVGGPKDGEWSEDTWGSISPIRFMQIKRLPTFYELSKVDMSTQIVDYVEDVYILKTLSTGSGFTKVYIHTSVNDPMSELLWGYRKQKNRKKKLTNTW